MLKKCGHPSCKTCKLDCLIYVLYIFLLLMGTKEYKLITINCVKKLDDCAIIMSNLWSLRVFNEPNLTCMFLDCVSYFVLHCYE